MQYAPTQVLFARQWLPSPVSDRQIHRYLQYDFEQPRTHDPKLHTTLNLA
jgi:hypothetical protein